MNTGERIRYFRTQTGLSPEKLAKLIGISGTYIRRLEGGERESITLDTARKFVKGFQASGLKVSVSDFIDDVPEPAPTPEDALKDIEVSLKAYIPVYGEVSAGTGMEPVDWVATTRAHPAPDTLRAFRVRGLCLDPEVKEGDTLIVDTSLDPRDGDLVVCIIDGEASVKKYHKRQPDRVREGPAPPTDWLENNHGTYRPDEVYQVGVVVEYTRKRR